jgi:cellobiose phosphorylase
MAQKTTFEFDDATKSLVVNQPRTPQPWINYLSNGRMHAFVSQAGGGFAWWKSPTIYRLTRYRQQLAPVDGPGFYIYLRERDGTVWSPAWRPAETPLDSWRALHRPGYTVFEASFGGLRAELELWVAPEHDALLWDLRLDNSSVESKRELDVFAYVEFSQLQWGDEFDYGYYIKYMLRTDYDAATRSVRYMFHHQNHPKIEEVPLVYFASSEADGWCGSREGFLGAYGTEACPDAVARGELDNRGLSCGEPAAALHRRVVVEGGGRANLRYALGAEPGVLLKYEKCHEKLNTLLPELLSKSGFEVQRRARETWWSEHLDKLSCELPEPELQRMIETWSPVNTVTTARFSRSVNAAAPGIRGVGFRDTCQDMIAMAYRRPNWALEKFRYLLTQQHANGRANHTAFPIEGGASNEGLHSDNHLWLPMLAHAIAVETGDSAFLDESEVYYASEETAAVWTHLMRAVEFTEAHLGAHGIPLTLKSDWNDIIGKFARAGRGESVFAGFQYVYVLRQMIELAVWSGRDADSAQLKLLLDKQLAALSDCAWDGKWWRRGFDDEGQPVGSDASSFGNVFLNPQSWAVLAGIGDAAQQRTGMAAAAEHLLTDAGLKILSPGFKTWPEVTDPFSGYGPGTGENGAIFCHANTWAIIAESILGNADTAWSYFRRLVPENLIKRFGVETYGADPHAWLSNIVGPENERYGWGNVVHISGTAAWMDVVASQYLLGIRAGLDGLHIAPQLPSDWDGFTVEREVRGLRVVLEVKRGTLGRLSLNGQNLESGSVIPWSELKDENTIIFESEFNEQLQT